MFNFIWYQLINKIMANIEKSLSAKQFYFHILHQATKFCLIWSIGWEVENVRYISSSHYYGVMGGFSRGAKFFPNNYAETNIY